MEKELPFNRLHIEKAAKTVYNRNRFIIVYRFEKCNKKWVKCMLKLPEYVESVLSALEAAGHEAWCVGGCVRDLRLGRVPEDWDVTTSARPKETMELFGERAVPTGLKHGTVTVCIDHRGVEVTTFRKDGEYRDHRRPEQVVFTNSLEEDLLRRDFTVNAMAINRCGKFCDPFGGATDLKQGVLRCVGEADRRFNEDALRILRGLRFAAQLGFSIEKKTAEAIRSNRTLLRDVAAERIWVEFAKLLRGKNAAQILREYPEVIGVFWPEILPMVGFNQKNYHHCYDIWEHTLHSMEAVPEDTILRCTMLLHDIGKTACFTVDDDGVGHFYGHAAISEELADRMLRRLRVDNGTRETVVRLVRWHDREILRTDKGIRRALRQLGETDLRRLIAVKRADNLAQAPRFRDRQREIDKAEQILNRLLEEDACFSLKQLAVNGNDLLAMGFQGVEIGAALDRLLNAVVDGELPNEREKLLAHLLDEH